LTGRRPLTRSFPRLLMLQPPLPLLPLLLLLLASRPSYPADAADAETPFMDLSTAISITLKNSRALVDSRLEQQFARALHRLAYRKFFPALELGLSRDDSVVYDSPDSRTRRLSVGLQQLIYDGGKTAAGLRRQKREITLARLNLEVESEALIFNVITLYTEILKFRQKAEIQQDTYRGAVLQHSIARKELDLGALTELDFLDFDVRLKDLELELERTEQERRLLLLRFGRLLGINSELAPPLPAGRLNPDYRGFISEPDEACWRGKALQRNPELRQGYSRVQEQSEVLRQAARSWLPAVRSSFSVFVSGQDYPLSEPGFEAGVELFFQLPVLPVQAAAEVGKYGPRERSLASSGTLQVLEGLEGLYSKKLARLDLSRATGDLDTLKAEIGFKIKELLFNINSRKKSLRLLREQIALEEKRSALQELKLELGQIKRIDFLDSKLELAGLRIELVSATVDLYNQEVSLLRLCGQPGLAETHGHIVIAGE
jgi:outer membrane protein TolC